MLSFKSTIGSLAQVEPNTWKRLDVGVYVGELVTENKRKNACPTHMPRYKFLKMNFEYGPNPASFYLFSSFSQHNDKYGTKLDYLKTYMVWLGFEPGTIGL